ncbi:Gfo/Idh/MocA family oxidoreductase [Caulobacter sp. 73W]|uniref:Gfo/Idh/MocA family oxidoreductase n=1 Tax=Caulobacter sp. 73W TaxID=3161137 RepID=A0AB39KVM1_9CAUL
MLRIGLLGASKIAPKAVLPPIALRDDVVVTAVAARDLGKAQAYAAQHGIATAVEGYEALIARDDVDLIYNALPPAAHLEWTQRAAAAGKHMLCEKPFAMTAAEARAMVDVAEAAGVVLIEAFHYRFHPMMTRALEVMASGELGRVLGAEAVFDVVIPKREGELRWIREQGGGALMDLGCYPLHALRTLLGVEPAVRSATARWDGGVDAALGAELDFGGTPARIHCDMEATERKILLRIDGDKASMTLASFVHPYRDDGGLRIGDRWEPAVPMTTYAAQLDHVIEVLAGRATPLTGGRDAIATMTAIDAIYAAAGR